MKRLLSILMAVLIVLALVPNSTFADSVFYVNTENWNNHEEYAKKYVANYVLGDNDSVDISYVDLGKGITIYDEYDYDKMLFPVIYKCTIYGTLMTVNYEDSITGIYTKEWASKLNELSKLTSKSDPLTLVVENDCLFGVIGNDWYDISGNQISHKYGNRITFGNNVTNAFETLDFKIPVLTRASLSKFLPWNIYEIQTGDYCYSYAMGNILMNMGYSSYTPSDIQEYTGYDKRATKLEMVNYLDSKGLKCSYSNSGYLSYDSVVSLIGQDYYIYIGCKDVDNLKESHAMVISGYMNDGGLKTYRIWNPWYSYTQAIDANSRLIATKTSRTFKWDNGYIHSIR